MKKIKVLLTVIICISILILSSCGNNENIQTDYGSSKIYTNDDMSSAVEVIKEDFSQMKGCKLYSINYAGDEICKENSEQYEVSFENEHYSDYIVFNVTFRSPLMGGGAWEKNTEYNWNWILVRESGGEWEVLTKGVG